MDKKPKALVGKITGNVTLEGYCGHRRATVFSIKSKKGHYETWKVSGTHIDRLTCNTAIRIKPSDVVKGWIDSYTTFDSEGNLEYSFPED